MAHRFARLMPGMLELVRQARAIQRRALWTGIAKVPRTKARGMPSEGRSTLGWAATAP